MAEIMVQELGRRASDDPGANANSGVTGRCTISTHTPVCIAATPNAPHEHDVWQARKVCHCTLCCFCLYPDAWCRGAPCSIPVSSHREGYALAAGAALGLIMLGAGHSAPGVSDLRLDDRLR
jgi:hypothetical protein